MTNAPYEVGAVTKRPAASKNDQPLGMGLRVSSRAATLVAYPPCAAPKTRSPTVNLGLETEEGVEITTPANSEPEIQGRGGWCWYFPAIWRRSKKFVAVAWMPIRYWSLEGTGSGRSVTLSSDGPCVCIRRVVWVAEGELTLTYSLIWIPRILLVSMAVIACDDD